MKKWLGQSLQNALCPNAPRGQPVPCTIRALHRLALALSGPHPDKGKVPARFHPGYYYDADLAQKLVDTGAIRTTSLQIAPDRYAYLQWQVKFSQGVLSQGLGSNADLIWVLTMPTRRARKPILFFDEAEDSGPKILDGSHRLIRSVVDGRARIDVEVIGSGDVHRFHRQ